MDTNSIKAEAAQALLDDLKVIYDECRLKSAFYFEQKQATDALKQMMFTFLTTGQSQTHFHNLLSQLAFHIESPDLREQIRPFIMESVGKIQNSMLQFLELLADNRIEFEEAFAKF